MYSKKGARNLSENSVMPEAPKKMEGKMMKKGVFL